MLPSTHTALSCLNKALQCNHYSLVLMPFTINERQIMEVQFYEKIYFFCITYGLDLMCNKILKVKTLCAWGVEFLTINIISHTKDVPKQESN